MVELVYSYERKTRNPALLKPGSVKSLSGIESTQSSLRASLDRSGKV